MCISCGCGDYNAQHDDERHITVDTLREAGAAAGITLAEVIENMRAGSGDLASDVPGELARQGGAISERLHPD
ncbi:MAG: hypothetical protein ACSLFM_01750 [Tepidiformaceae bacterium]